MMKSTIKHLSISLIPCFFLLIGCQERSNDDSDKFCTEYSGRPDVAITYPEMVAMLQQYDKTKGSTAKIMEFVFLFKHTLCENLLNNFLIYY